MRLNRGLLKWGLFFIVLGAVPLAVRQGYIAEDAAGRAWTLWPLLLVFGGIALILRRTPAETVADLAVSVTFGAVVGGIIATGAVPLAGCGTTDDSQPFAARSGELASNGSVRVSLNCGQLTIATMPGSGWSVDGSGPGGRAPRIDASDSRLSVDSPRNVGILDGQSRWTVTLPTGPELDLDAQVNAGSGRLRLDGARLGSLNVSVNAGDATIDLSSVSGLRELNVELNAVGGPRILLPNLSFGGEISANAAGAVRLCAPPGVGLRLTVNNSIAASNNYSERGLVRSGDSWETPGYASAGQRIDLRTEVNAGSFELEPEGTCGA